MSSVIINDKIVLINIHPTHVEVHVRSSNITVQIPLILWEVFVASIQLDSTHSHSQHE